MDDTEFLHTQKQGNLALLLLLLIHMYYNQERLPAYVIDGETICVPTPVGSTARAKGMHFILIKVTDTWARGETKIMHLYKSTLLSLITSNRIDIMVYGSNGDCLFLESSNDIIQSLCQLLATLMEPAPSTLMTYAEYIALSLMSPFRAVRGGVVVNGGSVTIIYNGHSTIITCSDQERRTRETLEQINSENGLNVMVAFRNDCKAFSKKKRCTESQSTDTPCKAFAWRKPQQCGSIEQIRKANSANLDKFADMYACLRWHNRP